MVFLIIFTRFFGLLLGAYKSFKTLKLHGEERSYAIEDMLKYWSVFAFIKMYEEYVNNWVYW